MNIVFNYVGEKFDKTHENTLKQLGHSVIPFYYSLNLHSNELLNSVLNVSSKSIHTLIRQMFLLDTTSSAYIEKQILMKKQIDAVITVMDDGYLPNTIPTPQDGNYYGIQCKENHLSIDPKIFIVHPVDFLSLTNFWKMVKYFTVNNFILTNPKSRYCTYNEVNSYVHVWQKWIYKSRLIFKELR